MLLLIFWAGIIAGSGYCGLQRAHLFWSWCYEGQFSPAFLVQNSTCIFRKIHLKQQSAPLFSCRCILFGDQMLCSQQKPWSSQGAFYRVKEGHGRKSFSDCTGGNWVAVLGLCHRFVHVLDFEGQFFSSTGVWELFCGLCSQGCCVRQGGETQVIAPLSPHYHVQEFALPWNGVIEAKR